MSRLLRLARNSGALKLAPKSLKMWIKSRLDYRRIHRDDWERSYRETISRAVAGPLQTDRRVCIVSDWMLRHAAYEVACLELGVPYSVLDVTSADWLARVAAEPANVYFVRPFVLTTAGRTLYEERAYFLSHMLGKRVFPDFDSLWCYESKRRVAALLAHHAIPSPKTWVFTDEAEAARFISGARYPLVFKTDLGSDATGVRILRSGHEAERIVRRCFGRGFASNAYDPFEVNRGQALFQEYVDVVAEWRAIRIGDSYFAYQKGRVGAFFSGSKVGIFAAPPAELLNLVRWASGRLSMNCAAVDVFQTSDGAFLISEVQTYYGHNSTAARYYANGKPVDLPGGVDTEMMLNGQPGRYRFSNGEWTFESGDFTRNAGCNLRVRLAFQELGEPLPGFLV